ncbi:amino acid ABC transporter membrane protein 2, PAAT family [Thiothrix caldifontis]|jgi:amine acid ABC transporter, permease protein, 3-TM region, His/Glu/Gln/Arg/opine family|uniref:Amino acid ABC transporter membrane protein 2, PAAT family n=1 Tax=Thiothrix caldifontis TaxID=525918 RepID=A0A1H4DYC2_9GAMM|nr:amino acid ABC transporter permease [Thiothrix caldifontis]SEA77751.1 amino acid ABC transporter membrane protein 2, PAAT family [Thiothrix caldifontis]
MAWLRANLFNNMFNSAVTLLLGMLLVYAVSHLWGWGIHHAVWAADAEQCNAARGAGACWGVVAEKYRVIIFGRYPFEEQWRPFAATLLLMALLLASCMRMFWKPWLAALWLGVLAVFFTLMHGGVFGLSVVTTDQWGGLPLTILLASLSVVGAFPLSILLALGRMSALPVIRTLCTVYVELIRGVPLISVLFMASFLFPLFMPEGFSIDVLLRVLVAMTLFAAAYLAEVIRGGLQAIPRGQYEAAASLGLTYWQMQRKIILPQALATVVPGIMNNFISTFKDTSLVTIVSLYELTGSLDLAVNSDPNWMAYKLEGYLFIAAIYFVFCFSLSRYSQWVERQVNRGKAH